MFKIALIGPQSTGKTTTTYGIAHELKADGYTVSVVMEAAREAAERNMPINSTTNVSTQVWILDYHELKELEAERKPADRSVLDGLPYTKLYLSPEDYEAIKTLALTYIKVRPYDLLLHFEPMASGPEYDGVRDSSVAAQIAVNNAFNEVLKELNLPSSMIYHVKAGDKRERLKEVMGVIRERFPMKPIRRHE